MLGCLNQVNKRAATSSKRWLILPLAGLLLLTACYRIVTLKAELESLSANELFSLPLLDSRRNSGELKDILDHAIVINAWASWCVGCREGHDLLMREAARSNIALIGLNVRDTREDGLRWLQFFGDPYRLSLYDESGHSARAVGIEALPATLVVDHDGTVRDRLVGPLSDADWRNRILPLLRGLEMDTYL